MVSVPAQTRPHVDAVVLLLRQLGTSVHVAQAPADPHRHVPFVVVWPDGGAVTPGSLADHLSDLVLDFQTTSVGATAEQALWMHDRVARALWAATPAVPGRTAQPIHATEPPMPAQRDDSLATPLIYVTARWRSRTTP